MKTIQQVKQFYDEATFRKLHGFIYSNLRIEYAWQSLNTIFDFKKPNQILEIGSGIGEISYRLASKFNNANIVGFDISEQSIKIASKLFALSNLSFVRADRITEIKVVKKDKFDIIFLMDVYEHIPVAERDELQQFIKENISENGFVFFSCPTRHHQRYLRENNPTDLQPVDEDITLKELIDFSDKTLLELVLYKEVSVWRTYDYFHAIFSNRLAAQQFCDFRLENKSQSIGLKREILKKIKRINKKNQYERENMIQEKKDLIKKKFGQEFLDRVEAYRK